MIAIIRYWMPGGGARIGIERDGVIMDASDSAPSIAAWLRDSCGRVAEAIAELEQGTSAMAAVPSSVLEGGLAKDILHLLPPVDDQDVWAAGVTYERSRTARQQEAVDGGDVYARVYAAARPELFFKARGAWVVGPGDAVGIRRDATWNVPEPELALLINPAGEIVGYTAGNDMSSRDIEGENPLYLPQAKIYQRSCALGPRIVLAPLGSSWPEFAICLHIERGGMTAFSGATSTSKLRRTPEELAHYLTRAMRFDDGAFLLTGTGIVPPDDFTLAEGDRITVSVDGVGDLVNTVLEVGAPE
jgi:2-dehydro-3-deoxy-D-arabinonate dehydratase